MSESPAENEAAWASSEVDFPGISISEVSPFGT